MKSKVSNQIKKWVVGLIITFIVTKIMNYLFQIED